MAKRGCPEASRSYRDARDRYLAAISALAPVASMEFCGKAPGFIEIDAALTLA